jgi:hypothetical protein
VAISDKKRKKIIADYTINQNYRETARMNNVSVESVRNIVKKCDEKVRQLLTEKKEQNTKDILEYMDSISDKQKKIIDLSLDAIEEKLSNLDMFTNVKDIATVYGVIFDKALKYKEIKIKNQEDNPDKINQSIVNIADLINNPVKVRTEEDLEKGEDNE